MKSLGWLGAVALVMASPAAAAGDGLPCLSRAQMDALFTYALPSIVQGARNACSATLPQSSWIRSAASAAIARYRGEGQSAWPAASAAFSSITGDKPGSGLAGLLGDDGSRALLDGVVVGAVSQQVKPKDCARIDETLSLLAPLPAANIGRLMVVLFQLGTAKQSSLLDKTPFRLCPAETQP